MQNINTSSVYTFIQSRIALVAQAPPPLPDDHELHHYERGETLVDLADRCNRSALRHLQSLRTTFGLRRRNTSVASSSNGNVVARDLFNQPQVNNASSTSESPRMTTSSMGGGGGVDESPTPQHALHMPWGQAQASPVAMMATEPSERRSSRSMPREDEALSRLLSFHQDESKMSNSSEQSSILYQTVGELFSAEQQQRHLLIDMERAKRIRLKHAEENQTDKRQGGLHARRLMEDLEEQKRREQQHESFRQGLALLRATSSKRPE